MSSGRSTESLRLLDCTLRDGGYYNDWAFSRELVAGYLTAVEQAGVDVVELGFRFLPRPRFLGPYAYTTDAFIEQLDVPRGLTLGVMINASDLIRAGDIRRFLAPKSASRVDLVRVAAHFEELPALSRTIDDIARLGYRVGLNLMQISVQGPEAIVDAAKMASSTSVDVLYFADSLGSMTSESVSSAIATLRQAWDGPLGIHTHDNMGRALGNTLRAIEDGATWVDSTALGMGRGPGNLRTEYLLTELWRSRGGEHYQMGPVLDLVREHFEPLQATYGWGPNPYYYLSGAYDIHPTYVQAMLSDSRYSQSDILAALEFLKEQGGRSFSSDLLTAAKRFYPPPAHGSDSVAGLAAGRDVLIVANGPSVGMHREALERLIRRDRPLVVALNTSRTIEEDLIDLRAACHPMRLVTDGPKYGKLRQRLVVPRTSLPDQVRRNLDGVDCIDFGIAVEEGVFAFFDTHCTTPAALVAAYAMGFAVSAGAERVLLAGFDGYGAHDAREAEMNGVFELFSASPGAVPVVSITPTRYHVQESSVYAMGI